MCSCCLIKKLTVIKYERQMKLKANRPGIPLQYLYENLLNLKLVMG